MQSSPHQYKYELEVDYPRPEWAHYIANALVVDKELKPKLITKTITVINQSTLKVYTIIQSLKRFAQKLLNNSYFLILFFLSNIGAGNLYLWI
jgi:hypothetical protein